MPTPDLFVLSVLTSLFVLVIVDGGGGAFDVVGDAHINLNVDFDVWVRCSFGNDYRIKHFSTPRKIKEEVFTWFSWLRKRISQLTCATVTILV